MDHTAPNVFIIGAQKCGTTSVYRFLSSQTGVFGPSLKEPNYLSFDKSSLDLSWRISNAFYRHNRVFTKDQYIDLYAQAPENTIWSVDGSASYLYSQRAAIQIKKINPDARIIVLLRNPIDRAFSEYRMQVAIGVETNTFHNAIQKELEKNFNNLAPLDRRYMWHGLYHEHIKSYLSSFDSNHIHYDCVDIPNETMDDVFTRVARFLDLDTKKLQLGHNENIGIEPSYPKLNALLYNTGIKALVANGTPKSIKERVKKHYYQKPSRKMSPADREKLWKTGFFKIEETESFSGLNLNHWRSDRDS